MCADDARPRWRCLLLPAFALALRNHAPAACMCGTIVGCALGALLPNNTSTLARVALALRYVPNDVTPLLLLPCSTSARYHDVAVRPTGVAEAIACYRQGASLSLHIHIACLVVDTPLCHLPLCACALRMAANALLSTTGVVCGSWLGAFFIPLDWDRPWQVMPAPPPPLLQVMANEGHCPISPPFPHSPAADMAPHSGRGCSCRCAHGFGCREICHFYFDFCVRICCRAAAAARVSAAAWPLTRRQERQ